MRLSRARLKNEAELQHAVLEARRLAGELGPHRDIVVLNAAAGIHVGGRTDSLAEGLELAAQSIDSGAAARTLERLAATSQAPA